MRPKFVSGFQYITFCRITYCTWAWLGSSQPHKTEWWTCFYKGRNKPHSAAAWILVPTELYIYTYIYKPKVVGKLFEMTNLCSFWSMLNVAFETEALNWNLILEHFCIYFFVYNFVQYWWQKYGVIIKSGLLIFQLWAQRIYSSLTWYWK